MTKTIQLLRGTTAQNAAFTGASGEVTVDTQTHELRVHDGSTAGGHIIYTKSDVDTALSGKADAATTYTKSDVDTALSSKADAATTLAGYGITDAYTKTEVDTSLSGKANTNLSNITADGKEVCAKMSMPSSSYDELTLGASGTTYTAPADGYVCVGGYNDSAPTGSITVQNVSAATLRMISNGGQGDWGCIAFIPLKKGDTFKISYANISVWTIKRFIYAQGGV